MKVFTIAAVCLAVVSYACANPSVQDNKIESDSTFSRAARFLGSCFESDDMTTCLAVKGIVALNRAARSNNIELVNGVSFKRDDTDAAEITARAVSETDIYAQLPENSEERNGHLIDMAIASATDLLGSHKLEVKVPTEATQEISRALGEGRTKRLKKKVGPLALAIGAKLFLLVPLFLGGLALFATKAIIVAKVALFLAFLVGGSSLFKLFGNKFGGALGGGYNSNAGWNSGSTGGWYSGSSSYPYARSMEQAQELAYSGQTKAE